MSATDAKPTVQSETLLLSGRIRDALAGIATAEGVVERAVAEPALHEAQPSEVPADANVGAVASGLEMQAHAGVEAFAKALIPIAGQAGDVEPATNPIKECFARPFGDPSEAVAAESIANDIREYGKQRRQAQLQDPVVASALGTVFLHAAKVAATAAQDPSYGVTDAVAHMERVIAAVLERVIVVAGVAAGTWVGAQLGNAPLGAYVGRRLAEAVGPRIAGAVARGAVKVGEAAVTRVRALTRRVTPTVISWLEGVRKTVWALA